MKKDADRYKLIVLCLFVWLFGYRAFAQRLDLNQYNVEKYDVSFDSRLKEIKIWNEAPPVALKSAGGYTFISTTYFSTAWEHRQNLATPSNDHFKLTERKKNKHFYVTSSSHWWQKFFDPQFLNSENHIYKKEWATQYWRRNYNGIFSAHVVENDETGAIVFALSHGENKNEKIQSYFYQNTVRPSFKINESDPKTYSGGKPYTDCWEAYFGFLNGNWATYNNHKLAPAYFNDIGPVAWPSAGYVTKDGEQLSQGLRHPSSIMHEGYVYIYVLDTSMDGTGGVKLIRVKASDVKNPQQYTTWSKSDGWISALPKNFSKDAPSDFFSVRGPESDPVVQNDKNIIRFSVAKFTGTANEFIAVEEYINNDQSINLALRYSTDLINWSERDVIYRAAEWSESKVRYPVFLNKAGLTDGLIDKDEFYIIGTQEDGKLTKLYFKLKRTETAGSKPSNGNLGTGGNSQSGSANFTTSATNTQSVISRLQVAPVPVNALLDVEFEVKSLTRVSLSLHNLNGSLVADYLEETFLPQTVKRTIDFSDLAAGVYILTISDTNQNLKKRIVKL